MEAIAVCSVCDRSGSDRPAGDFRLAWPLRLGAFDWVDSRAVQGEPRIPPQIRALACMWHGAKDELAVLEGSLYPGDTRRAVSPHGGYGLVSVGVEQRKHPLRKLRRGLFDIPP